VWFAVLALLYCLQLGVVTSSGAAAGVEEQYTLEDMLVGLRLEKELAASSTAAPPSPLLLSGMVQPPT
jgi:hypothetical protein